MESNLFSSMAFIAVHSIFAATFFNRLNSIREIPVFTLLRQIFKLWRLPPEILKIMGIDTFIPLMTVGIRAPYGFILVDIEISIHRWQVNELNSNFSWGMSKWTELPIFTFFNIFRIMLTELALVPAGMIQLFNFIMAELTLRIFTVIFADKMSIVEAGWSSSVPIMIIKACFSLMWVFPRAVLRFECSNVKPEELTILKSNQIVNVHFGAVELKGALHELVALFTLVLRGVVQLFEDWVIISTILQQIIFT